jgi:short-subunit dehydrogenase
MSEMNTPDKSCVLITGASSGFGEEFARQYAEQGHSLVLVARRLARLQTLAEALRQQFRIEVVVEQVDLSDIAAIVQLHQRLCERGIEVDSLINNAGHGLQGPFADAPLDAVLSMVQLDVASLTAVTHVFSQGMRTRKHGKILLVASLLAYQGVENFAVYSAAKAYVLAWLKPFIANSNATASRSPRFVRGCRTPDSPMPHNRKSRPC